jgi:CRISPR-associated protein Cas2
MTEARLYVVAYDVASPRRWRRVVKAVKRLGRRAQLSVFICRATPQRIARLDAQLRRILDPATDRLVIVDLGVASAQGVLPFVDAAHPAAQLVELGAVIV